MRKYMYICSFAVLCLALLLFTACMNKESESNMNNTFFDGYVMDDVKVLEDHLTKEYDLNELQSFFHDSNANEGVGLESTTTVLTFSKVNSKYPVEILRTGGYSVYRVSQGGYFYVFWVKPFVADTNSSSSEPAVYFSAYLSSDISPDLFNSLTPGISTAEDVKEIDPSFELSFLISNGIFSYSYINDETILQIEYMYQENIDGYEDLIVKNKLLVARDSVPSRYSALLTGDTPGDK